MSRWRNVTDVTPSPVRETGCVPIPMETQIAEPVVTPLALSGLGEALNHSRGMNGKRELRRRMVPPLALSGLGVMNVIYSLSNVNFLQQLTERPVFIGS